MSAKHGDNSIFTILKLLVTFAFVLFGLYTIQWFSGSSSMNIHAFEKETLTIVIENTEFQLETDKIITKQGNSPEIQNDFLSNFFFWIGLNKSQENIGTINKNYIQEEVSEWEKALGFKQVSEGSITLEKNNVIMIPPHDGMSISRDQLYSSLLRQARKPESYKNYELHIRTKKSKPSTTEQELEDIVSSLEQALQSGITLTNKEYDISHQLTTEDIQSSLSIFFNAKTKEHEIYFDTASLEEYLKQYTTEAVNAEFEPQADYSVTISPSRKGLSIDMEETQNSLVNTIKTKKDVADIIFLDPLEPEFSTQDAESLGVEHLVSSFTTFYSCCEARARNIQNFAQSIDGAVVGPGEEFNMNTYVGQRTKEKGFEPAGTLVKGVLIETTGGGISQFTTTFFNAVYWGGYKNISHKPHSRYFSRYPEGIEATVSWPEPHLIFQNDTDSGIVIKASFTETSVTVSFYGNNDGRVMVGDHRYGGTVMQAKREGGPQARIVVSEVGEPQNQIDPKEIYYTKNSIEPNTIQLKSEGRPSYQVRVHRDILQNNQTISTDIWNVRYLSEDREFWVERCEYAPEFSVCRTPEDIEKEKDELLEFYEKLENGN